MQFVGKVISSVSEFYKDINPATLSGAIDVIVVEDVETGELACSPFHVRFGKLQLLRPQEKAVELVINGEALGERLRMKVGEAGETFFVLPREGGPLAAEYLTSPLPQATLPVPLESVEDLRLQSGFASGDEPEMRTELHVTEITTTLETSANATDKVTITGTEMAIVAHSNAIGSPGSSEWKWEWGDLPIKKEHPDDAADEVGVPVTEVISIQPLKVPSDDELVTEPQLKSFQNSSDEIPCSKPLPQTPLTINFIEYLQRPRVLDRMLRRLKDWPRVESIRVYRLLNKTLIDEESDVDESTLVQMDAVVLDNFTGQLDDADLIYCFNDSIYLPSYIGVQITLQWSIFQRIDLNAIKLRDEVDSLKDDLMDKVILDQPQAYSNGSSATMNMTNDTHSSLDASLPVTDIASTADTALTAAASAIIPASTVTASSSTASLPAAGTAPVSAPVTSSWRSWWPSRRDTGSNTSSGAQVTSNTDVTTSSLTRKNSASSYDTAPIASPSNRSVSPTPSNASIRSSGSSAGISANNYNSSYASLSTTSAAPVKQYIKSLRLPSEMLKSLNLKAGVNTISYSVTTKLQGTATCHSRIFLWRSTDRIVISDIDGTITKSDALGHLFTMVGKDWTHVGVASLFTKISANGYQFMYLTSRAIGQAASTRGYLKGIEQDRYQLPDGPVIMSPDRLFTALHREVIQRRPDEFKISCLRDIQRLFHSSQDNSSDPMAGNRPLTRSPLMSSSDDESIMSSGDEVSSVHSEESFLLRRGRRRGARNEHTWNNTDESALSSSTAACALLMPVSLHMDEAVEERDATSPFYAGFGNRPTDTRSYKAVGIPAPRIFIINSAGDLKLDTMLTFYTPHSTSSYLRLSELVDKVFPPLSSPSALTRAAGEEAFSDFQYWHGSGEGSVRMELVEAALASVSKSRDSVMGGSGRSNRKPSEPGLHRVGLASALDDSTADGLSDVGKSSTELMYSPRAGSPTLGARFIIGSPSKTLPNRKSKADSQAFEEKLAENDEESSSSGTEDDGRSMASITAYPYM